MSLIHMESFAGYTRYAGDDSGSTANNAQRTLAKRAFDLTGYETFFQNGPTSGWVVRQHPVFPDRNAMVFSAPAAENQQYIVRKSVGVGAPAGSTLVGGFSLFVPTAFLSDTATGGAGYPFLYVVSYPASAAINSGVPAGPDLAANELFRVRYDLKIGRGSEVLNTSRVPQGKLCYLEFRITATDTRVYLDDVLVYQATRAASIETIGIGTVTWVPSGGYTSMFNESGRWAIADMYFLLEDTVKPNVRLGPTTRVIATKADSDSVAQFSRPAGFTSNASVAALPFNPDSSNALKTDTVGAKDVYTPALDSPTSTAALVHAMGVKVIAQNLDSAAHTMAPIIVSDDAEFGVAQPMTSALKRHATYTAVDPKTGVAWTPAAAALAKFGMKLAS